MGAIILNLPLLIAKLSDVKELFQLALLWRFAPRIPATYLNITGSIAVEEAVTTNKHI